ncbi:hypothetical protein HPB48_023035 [Haemaphysalis longicornis]|uniref:Sulfotransferase n=1 Tax=Haemaphysalis longicornis TaxID=44386 RepID=A0A9J6G9G8_HAELO|nr:hypothetical protein HPB48_023035 [Haemaphysalis longicornis]
MRSDLDSFEELAKRMQPNRTLRLRFEDLAADPENEAPQLFRYLGLNYTTAVSQYVKSHTRATFRDLRNAHSTKRNPHRVAVEWKRKLSNGTIHAIERACSDVLLRLNYELLTLSEKGQIPAPAWFKGDLKVMEFLSKLRQIRLCVTALCAQNGCLRHTYNHYFVASYY